VNRQLLRSVLASDMLGSIDYLLYTILRAFSRSFPGLTGFHLLWYRTEPKMNDYQEQKWVELYRAALLELENSLMAGRIREARAEIIRRLEELQQMPGLHQPERQAIEDATNGLQNLEREEAQHAYEQEQRIAREGLAKLRSLRPRIENLKPDEFDSL